MNIGVFHVDRGETPHRALAAVLITSVRRAMPRVSVLHLTDPDTAPIEGVDGVAVRPAQPIALACLDAYAACDGDWLFVDTDVIVQRDVRHVFDRPFDIAVATREGTFLPKEIGSKFMDRMPFNKGAVFSRCPAFWRAAADRLRTMSSRRQQWMGDQQAMNDVIATGQFCVAVLPAAYNYPPRERQEDLRDQFVVHYKGSRKAWMPAWGQRP